MELLEPDKCGLKRAVKLIRSGELVIWPCDI